MILLIAKIWIYASIGFSAMVVLSLLRAAARPMPKPKRKSLLSVNKVLS